MVKNGLLLVGHGSSMPYNQELVEKTADMIRNNYPDYVVKTGFMNINKPSIKESLNEFQHEPIDKLVVVPLFLAKGIHIEKDIPCEIGLPEGMKNGIIIVMGKQIPLVYAEPIGVNPLLTELMMKNATQALALI
jgi:sirohydrochlorin cobaltochelatase